MTFRAFATAFALVATLAAIVPATAQSPDWPTRTVTMIVPFGAGGSVDVVGRLVAQKLGERLGQTVIVENVSGAGGAIGTVRGARAEPDGYTIVMGVESTMAIAKLVQPNIINYDSLKDFAPVALIGTSPIALVARKELPASTVEDFLALLRANPGKYSFATSGVGTSLHLAGEMINLEAKVQMTHLPYRVGSQIATDLIGGHIDLAIVTLLTALPALRGGDVKVIGLTGKTASPLAPELKPLASAPDLKNLDVSAWYALFVPAKTNDAIVQRLNREIAAVAADPDMRLRLADLSVDASTGGSPQDVRAFIAGEIEKYAAIVKAANIRVE